MWKHLTTRRLERMGRRGGWVKSGPEMPRNKAKRRAKTFDRLSRKQHRWRLTWTPKAVLTLAVLVALTGVGLGGLVMFLWLVL